MKILASGDLHGDSGLAKKLAKRAEEENVDLVILCGDLTNFETSTKNIIGPFKKIGKKVLIIPGNHETVATADFLAQVYGVKNIHGYSVVYDDVGIFGAGGATNVGPVAPISEQEMFELLKKGSDKLASVRKRIMVTHVHPEGSMMESFSSFVPPSSAVRKAVDELQPDILLCSHVHEADGIEEKIGKTKVINVGKRGKIIEI
ncbi:metallophosphoesterase [Candidatus Woesearchaeota archaeon]|nr:metallophosphoesterase [Candidatus Woesearchaeota archaeon]MBW3021625.1 metallophosphoesterase [Candidatus Woesearchaeota archaeon]